MDVDSMITAAMMASEMTIVTQVFSQNEDDPDHVIVHNVDAAETLMKMVHDIPEDFETVGGWQRLHMSLVGKEKSEIHYLNFFKTMAMQFEKIKLESRASMHD